MEHGGTEAEAPPAHNGFCFLGGWGTTTTGTLDERQPSFIDMYADPTRWNIHSVYHILNFINITDEIRCPEWFFPSGGSSLSPLKEVTKPNNFEPLVPYQALLELYKTTPIWSLGRLTEAYLLTRQPRVDPTVYGTSQVSSQAAASTSSQAQSARDNPRSDDLAPGNTDVEQQQGQQGQAASGPRTFRPDQLGSGSLLDKQFDCDGRQRGADGHALSGTTTTHNSLAGSGRDAGVEGGTLPCHAREPTYGESGPGESQAVAFVNNARVEREILTDDGGNGTDKLEEGTEMYGIARNRRPIWMTTSIGNQPRNRHVARDDAGYQVNRSVCRLRRLNGKAIGLSMLSFMALGVSADVVHHRAAKVAATAVSALVSFGTGMTSLQLEVDSSAGGTRVAKMCLRIFSSTFLLALIGCFMHWFCAGAERMKRFIAAAFAVLFFGWVLNRVVATPSAGDVIDTFSWLDKVNLFGLLAAVAGITNVRTDGMLRAQVDEVLGSGTSANPLLPLTGNDGRGASELLSVGERSGKTGHSRGVKIPPPRSRAPRRKKDGYVQ